MGEDYPLLPRARFVDIIVGKARLVGTRLDKQQHRGFVSPIESRIYTGQVHLSTSSLQHEEQRLLERSSVLIVLFSVIYSRLIFGSRTSCREPACLFGISLFSGTLKNLQHWLLSPESDKPRRIAFANAHNLNQSLLSTRLRSILKISDVILPDGVGLRLAARLSSFHLQANLNGTDLFPHLCKLSAFHAIPIVLIGGHQGVGKRCAQNMADKYPDLSIDCLSHGYDLDNHAITRYLTDLTSKNKRVFVLVGLGTPLQEFWIDNFIRNNSIERVDYFSVGGLLDYYSGNVKRAPITWQSNGLEWLWRVIQEPKRLLLRYGVGIPFFLTSVIVSQCYAGIRRCLALVFR